MSENLHNIDDLFKRAIDEHEDTPSQKVWDAIDKNLDKKTVVSISKKYNKLKWAAAVLLLFSAGMAMYVWQTRIQNKELVIQNNINKAVKSTTETLNSNDKRSTLPEIKTPAGKNNDFLQKNSAKVVNEQSSATIGKQKVAKPSVQKIIISDKVVVPQALALKQNEKLLKINKGSQLENTETKSANTETSKAGEHNYTEKYFAEIPLIYTNQMQWNNLNAIQSLNPFSYKPEATSPGNTVASENNNNKRSAAKKSRPANHSPFSVTAFFSPEFIFTNIKDDHPRFREDDKHEIKNNERQRPSSTYGVLLNYNIGNNWALQSGVTLFTRVTDINTKTIYARPDNGGNVNYRLSCSAGSAYFPLKTGAAPAQGDSTKILSAKNTLRYFSIPVAVKYSIGKGKLNFVPAAGFSVNILSKGKVETVIATSGSNQSSTNDIEGLKPHYFTGQLSLGAEYHLSKKIILNFTPAAKLALSSINKNAAVRTKLNAFGLSAGITVKL